MSDPHEKDGISVTLKQDGKDGTWVVFHGSPARIREQIIEVFGLKGEEDSPLFDLINEATRLYKAAGNINSSLGGRVVTPKGEAGQSQSGNGSAWDRAANGNGASAPAEPEVDPNVTRLEAAIEAATDVASLKELFARNKVHFDANPDLVTVWKAKGKALS